MDTFERLKYRVEYSFHRLKSIRDIEKKLGRNVEYEQWPVYNKKVGRKKERKRKGYRISNDGYEIFTILDAILPASDCGI